MFVVDCFWLFIVVILCVCVCVCVCVRACVSACVHVCVHERSCEVDSMKMIMVVVYVFAAVRWTV